MHISGLPLKAHLMKIQRVLNAGYNRFFSMEQNRSWFMATQLQLTPAIRMRARMMKKRVATLRKIPPAKTTTMTMLKTPPMEIIFSPQPLEMIQKTDVQQSSSCIGLACCMSVFRLILRGYGENSCSILTNIDLDLNISRP